VVSEVHCHYLRVLPGLPSLPPREPGEGGGGRSVQLHARLATTDASVE
jgi:hypothetical protein